MRNVKELYHQLTEQQDFDKKYPTFNEENEKIHLLYISPCLNGTGYYRSIIPMLELNRTNSHAAIITDIHKWSFNQQLLDYVTPVDERLVKWANYIILPPMLENATYLMQGWRSQNRKLKFVMDLDSNYHVMPKQHLDYPKVSPEHRKQLLSNVAQMDVITAANEGLLDYYDELVEKYHPQSNVFMEYLPNLISQFGYQEVAPLNKNESGKIRIGIVGDGACSYDVLSILDVLKAVSKKYENKVELIIFGWNGKLPNGQQALEGVKFTYQKSVAFLDYFDQLNKLALDIALIPAKRIPFNTHGKSFIDYLEFAVFAIPVVAVNNEPYTEIIEDKETGFLVNTLEEWLMVIDQLIAEPELRTKIGKSALKRAWSKYSYTHRRIEAYQEIFI